MSKKFFAQKSVLTVWIISYVLIILVPIICNAMVFVKNQQVLENKILEVNTSLMDNVRQGMDGIFTNTVGAYTDLTNNEYMTQLSDLSSRDSEGFQYKLYKAISAVSVYDNYISEYQNYFVYYKKLDMVIGSNEDFSSKDFYKSLKSNGFGYEEWSEMLEKERAGFIPLENNETGEKQLMYFRYFMENDRINPETIFLMVLDQKIFDEYTQNLKYNEAGTAYILDKNNKVILSNKPVPAYTESYYEHLPANQHTLRMKKENATLIYFGSKFASWKYCYLLPTNVLMNDIGYTQNLIVFSLAISALISLVIMFTVIRKQYKPIHNLIQMLDRSYDKEYQSQENEYIYLEKRLAQTLNEKNEAEQKLSQQRKALKTQYLSKILKGTIDDRSAIRGILEDFEVDCKNAKFGVILFYVKDYTMLFQEDHSLTNEQRVELTHFILTNIGEELICEKYHGFMFECDDMMACLVTTQNDLNAAIEENMSKTASSTVQAIGKNFDISCCAAISQVYDSFLDIPEAYTEATEAMEHLLLTEKQKVLKFSDLRSEEKEQYAFPLETKQAIVQGIRSGDKEKVGALIENVLYENGNVIHIQGLALEFISVLIRCINEMNLEIQDTVELQQLLSCNTLSEMKRGLDQIVQGLCSREKEDKNDEDIVFHIKNYIQEHYQDNNLNVAEIGRKFGKTPYYISKLFKDSQGTAMLEYINHIRVEKAKELLNSTKDTLDVISEKVGFTNVVTFMRVFKKHTGITPGKFRGTGAV